MVKMRRGQGNRHFQIFKAIFADMKAGSIVGHRERLGWRVESSDKAPALGGIGVDPNQSAVASVAQKSIGKPFKPMSVRNPRRALFKPQSVARSPPAGAQAGT